MERKRTERERCWQRNTGKERCEKDKGKVRERVGIGSGKNVKDRVTGRVDLIY